MLGMADIQTAAENIRTAEKRIDTETLYLTNPTFEVGDAQGLVKGDMQAGATAKGLQSLLVESAVTGSSRWPCRIEMKGDVIVMGSVEHAQIKGRNIWIGGAAKNCQLAVQRDIEVGAELADARITCGVFDIQQDQIQRVKKHIRQAEQKKDSLERQLIQGGRSLGKQFKTTRIALGGHMEKIIRYENNQVKINLQPLLQAVGEKAEEEQVFLDFFTRGIVPLLTRANQAALQSNPIHQKAFIGVIKNLRRLFSQTLQCDRQAQRIEENKATRSEWVRQLRTQSSAVHVKGAVVPPVELQFVRPEVEPVDEEEYSIRTQTTKLVFQPGSAADEPTAISVSIKGEESTLHPSAEELQGISLRVQEGQVVWEPLQVVGGQTG